MVQLHTVDMSSGASSSPRPRSPAPDVTVWQADGIPFGRQTYATQIARRLRAAGFLVEVVDLTRGPPRPSALARSRHVVSGGATPSSADVEWMVETRRHLAQVVDRAMAGQARVVGICLGSQLLAEVLAGPTAVRCCARGMEAGLRVVHDHAGGPDRVVSEFHFMEVDPAAIIGAGATILRSNDHSVVQSFTMGPGPDGPGIVGHQFHPEFDAAALARVLARHRSLVAATATNDPHQSAGRWDGSAFEELVVAPLRRVGADIGNGIRGRLDAIA